MIAQDILWECFLVMLVTNQANVVMESGRAKSVNTISAPTAEQQKSMEAAKRCIAWLGLWMALDTL